MKICLRALVTTFSLFYFVSCALAQERTPAAVSLQVGVGNSLSLKQFTQDDTALNTPGTAFMQVRLAANLAGHNHRSTYLGLEAQALNFYPTNAEKTNLTYVTVLVGKTRRFDVTRELYLLYTGAFGLSTLANVSSSAFAHDTYSGLFKNGNFRILNTLQTMLATPQTNAGSFDIGMGLEIGLLSGPFYRDKAFPAYLKPSSFLQYGLNLNMRYNFRSRFAQ